MPRVLLLDLLLLLDLKVLKVYLLLLKIEVT